MMDAHMWWEAVVKLYLNLDSVSVSGDSASTLPRQEAVSMHLWSEEYSQFLGSVYDKPFTYSNTVRQHCIVGFATHNHRLLV